MYYAYNFFPIYALLVLLHARDKEPPSHGFLTGHRSVTATIVVLFLSPLLRSTIKWTCKISSFLYDARWCTSLRTESFVLSRFFWYRLRSVGFFDALRLKIRSNIVIRILLLRKWRTLMCAFLFPM